MKILRAITRWLSGKKTYLISLTGVLLRYGVLSEEQASLLSALLQLLQDPTALLFMGMGALRAGVAKASNGK